MHLLEEVHVQTVFHAPPRARMNFRVGPKIGACGSEGRYFSARLPLEDRSEGGALVGVLFSRNGGR